MIASKHPVRYSFSDYLRVEADSDLKHEYLDGQIYAMAGGTPEHAALAHSVGGHLFAQLRGSSCVGHTSDLRVRVLETGLTTYPDVTVVCGQRELHPEDKHTVINPAVIVEVLSPSTEDYDRGEKFEHYQRAPSLREYVLVAHDRREIEVRTRRPDGSWDRTVSGPGEIARLPSIRCELEVDAVYADAAFRP